MSKIKEVARAMYADTHSGEGPRKEDLDFACELDKQIYISNAKAAIRAMLEPTDQMLGAYRKVCGARARWDGYNAMITAALGDE